MEVEDEWRAAALEGFEWREVPGQDAYEYRRDDMVVRITALELRNARRDGGDCGDLIRERWDAVEAGDGPCYCATCRPQQEQVPSW